MGDSDVFAFQGDWRLSVKTVSIDIKRNTVENTHLKYPDQETERRRRSRRRGKERRVERGLTSCWIDKDQRCGFQKIVDGRMDAGALKSR